MNQLEQEFEDNEEYLDLDSQQTTANDEINNPFPTKNVKITTNMLSMSNLVSRLKYEEIDLQPAFQRKSNLWNKKQMSRLIESILLKLPLPILYFDVADPSKWLVVDGLQRLSTIYRFMVETNRNKKLKLAHLEFLTDLNGKTFNDLERPMQRIIEETQLVTYQIEPQTPKEIRYSIFNRINTGGLSLNAQEIRQALNQKGDAVKFLKKVTEEFQFKEIVKVRNERMLDRELALRFFAFKIMPDISDLKSLSSFLDKAMEKLDNMFNLLESHDLADQLIETLLFSEKLLGKKHRFSRSMADNKKTKTLNRSMFDVLTVCFSEIENKDEFLRKKDLFNKEFIDILKNDLHPFTISINQGTGSRNAVITRFSEMRKLIKKIEDS